MTSSTRSPSSLPLYSFATALTIFQGGERFLELRCVRFCCRSLDRLHDIYSTSSGTPLGVPKLSRSLQAQRTPLLSCSTHYRAAVSRTTELSISRSTARTPSSCYSSNNLYLQTILYGLQHTRTARPFVSPSLGPSWWCIWQLYARHMNIEFGVVRWARGEYDSYFCR